MAKDLLMRKCSHCGHNGHNSRTCNGKGCLKLFGVKIEKPDDNSIEKSESIRRSKSAGNLQSLAADSRAAATSGYHSDAEDRRKGKLWTEEEHRSFLLGLEKLGKGDWRGISKSYVPTRTSTQVASHAQKYFIRMATLERKKRRSSVFDISINEVNADSTSPEEPSNDFDRESLAMLYSSNQAMIPFENLAHKNRIEATTHVVASSERPPLIPSMRYRGSFDYPTMPYMIGPASSSRPAFSYDPRMNFPVAASNSVYVPSAYNNVNFALPLMVAPLPHQAKPPPPMMTSMDKNAGLDLSLGRLSL